MDGIKEAAHKGERHVSRPAVDTLFVRLSGSGTLQSKVPTVADLQLQLEAKTGVRRLVVDARELTGWDSGLVTLLRNWVSQKRRGLPMEGSTLRLSAGIQHAQQALELDRIQRRYWAQNECVVLEHFLPDEVLAQYLLPEAEKLRAHVHRNYIPRHKKGGSVSYYTLVEKAPAVLTLYRHPAFIDFLTRLVGAPVMPCPEDDPHACALYFYTEPGDHIGFHYDTSYYRGARYTVLVGLVQRSQHCQLVCQLYKGDPTRERQDLQLITHPGAMVIFNGDKLWYAVTPLEPGAERIMLTMEYVTNLKMGGFKRLISNMKDAIAYFGISALWRGCPSARRARATAGNLPFSQGM